MTTALSYLTDRAIASYYTLSFFSITTDCLSSPPTSRFYRRLRSRIQQVRYDIPTAEHIHFAAAIGVSSRFAHAAEERLVLSITEGTRHGQVLMYTYVYIAAAVDITRYYYYSRLLQLALEVRVRAIIIIYYYNAASPVQRTKRRGRSRYL